MDVEQLLSQQSLEQVFHGREIHVSCSPGRISSLQGFVVRLPPPGNSFGMVRGPVVTAPVELAKNVANFGDDFAAAVFAKNDYEMGRLAFKPVSTAMMLTAAVMGPRAGGKSPAKSATTCPCFSADSWVQTCDGLRNIADIQMGDLVWSHDPETGTEACQPVLQVFITPGQAPRGGAARNQRRPDRE